MSARRLGWIAAVAGSLGVAVGPVAIAMAYFFEQHARRPVLLILGSAFVLCALVVAIRARLTARLASAPPRKHRPAAFTLVVATCAWILLFAGAVMIDVPDHDDSRAVLYAHDHVPWARLALLWLVASVGVAVPAARWCYRVGAQPEGPSRF